VNGPAAQPRDATELAAELRKALVTELVADGSLPDPAWQAAFTAVPRHLLVPRFYAQPGYRLVDSTRVEDRQEWLAAVYRDSTLITQITPASVTSSGTMPSLVAAMLHDLDVADGHRVLQVGTGTGYTAALLCHRLGDHLVTSIDIDPGLCTAARKRLAAAGYHPLIGSGNGANGYPARAPYDRILATCGLTRVPPAWLAQTRPGGKILAPIASGLALLEVDGDRAAGRFLSGAYFMPLRGTAATRPGPAPHSPAEPAGPSRQANLPSTAVYDGPFRFHLSIALPSLSYANGGNDLADLYLSHPDGSRAHITPAGTVTQNGPRRLWDEVEAAHSEWEHLGKPSYDAYLLTIRHDQQLVRLDTDHIWQLPAA